jgi:hypothetical protein
MQSDQQDVLVWDAGWRQCSEVAPVWCVADEVDTVGTCSIPQFITCGQQVSGSNVGEASHHSLYSCSPWNESGPDVIYGLNLPAALSPYTVTATLGGLSADLDVFILSPGECGVGECATAGSYGDFVATATNVTGGIYYIAVDGYNGAVSGYTLSVECDLMQVYQPLVLRDYP